MFRRGEEERDAAGPIHPKEVGMGDQGTGSDVTVVGTGARLEGTLVSAGSLRVDGQVKGRITAEGDVALSPQSKVEADIDARNVTVAGQFRGNILAKEKAELARGGRVEGNIASKALVVAEGALFTGQSTMGEAARPAAPAQPQPQAGRTQESDGQGQAAPTQRARA